VFNALHGRGGEDGCMQGQLELLGIPYTHSGVRASAVAMDKPLTRLIAQSVGVPVAKGLVASRADVQSRDVLPPPYVVKPTNEGSSVGVRIINKNDNFRILAEDSWIYGDEVLVEEFIPGHELTVAVLGEKALNVTELRPKVGFYDYAAKYTDGMTDHLIPAPVPDEIREKAMAMAVTMHKTLGCCGISRSDLRWDSTKPGTSGLFFLEINTQPGFTPLSLVPEQAQTVGMSYADLCVWLVENAKCHA